MDQTNKLFAALSSPIRHEILWRVWREELPAGEIAKAFDICSTVAGFARRAYLTIKPTDTGCHVEMNHMVETAAQATYTEATWRVVLGRFKDEIVGALALEDEASSA
jgi:DNA-binding transcriptional ArsR family regulator